VLSRRTSLTRPNGVNTNNYDSLSRLLSVLHQASGVTIDGAVYTYDNAGNRLSKLNELNGATENYVYDPTYQLTQVQQIVNGTPSVAESYSYDLVGNRLSSLDVGSYTYNSSNELTASSDGYSYTYDNNGNTLTKTLGTNITSFAWDSENRLTQVTLPGTGGAVTFKYDPFGRRIRKVSAAGTTDYVYDGANTLDEVDGSGGVLARYSHGRGVDELLLQLRSGVTNSYEGDALGSITSLSNAAAQLASTYTYSAFGNLDGSSVTAANSFRYTGRDFDAETSLHYYRARYYDQGVGRFLNEDPVSFDGGTNFFRYVSNNPTDLTDPRGLKSCVLTPTGYVCWDDGNPNGGTIFDPRPLNPIPSGISGSFAAFANCANHSDLKCKLPATSGGNPFSPPGGAKGDMGLTPSEGTVPIPQFGDQRSHACSCLKQYPLAALDPRFTFRFGDQNFGIDPACMVEIF
jgi:RHS repeat-associated protein